MSEPQRDYEPVRVHMVADSTKAPGQARGKVVTRFGTETVDNANPVRPLLPDDPGRVCAWVQATGGNVYLCDSESKAIQAAGQVNSGVGTFLPAANTAPWELLGSQAVWIAQVSTGTTCVVGYTADYET